MSLHLVTGASGFLGRHLVQALTEKREQVRGLIRKTSDTAHLAGTDIELVTGDLEDLDSLIHAVEGVDVVYHCAARVTDWGTKEDFLSANVTGVKNLLTAMVRSGTRRLIHVSSTDVYGYPDFPADESAPMRFRGFNYGDTKIMAEELVNEYAERHGLQTTIIRPASIYGPWSISLVREIADLLRAGEMVLIGSGNRNAGLAYVSNVADLMLCTAENSESIGHVYNANDGIDTTWKEYIWDLAEAIEASPPGLRIPYRLAYAAGWAMERLYALRRKAERPLLTRMAVSLVGTTQGFPNKKAVRELGFQPKIGYREGMRRSAAWLSDPV